MLWEKDFREWDFGAVSVTVDMSIVLSLHAGLSYAILCTRILYVTDFCFRQARDMNTVLGCILKITRFDIHSVKFYAILFYRAGATRSPFELLRLGLTITAEHLRIAAHVVPDSIYSVSQHVYEQAR